MSHSLKVKRKQIFDLTRGKFESNFLAMKLLLVFKKASPYLRDNFCLAHFTTSFLLRQNAIRISWSGTGGRIRGGRWRILGGGISRTCWAVIGRRWTVNGRCRTVARRRR